jgi:hypothetical protein
MFALVLTLLEAVATAASEIAVAALLVSVSKFVQALLED